MGWGEKEKFLREISLSSTLLLQNLERQEKMDCGCRVKDFKITLSLPVPPPLSTDFKECAWWFNKEKPTQFSSVQFSSLSTCPSPSRSSYTWIRACALTVTLTRAQRLNLIKKEEKQKKERKKETPVKWKQTQYSSKFSTRGPDECQADILRWLMKCQAGACVYRRPPLLKSWRALFSRENASGAERRRLCCN